MEGRKKKCEKKHRKKSFIRSRNFEFENKNLMLIPERKKSRKGKNLNNKFR